MPRVRAVAPRERVSLYKTLVFIFLPRVRAVGPCEGVRAPVRAV
jgi:hypothetical protein